MKKAVDFAIKKLAAADSGVCHCCGGGFCLHPFIFLEWMERDGKGKRVVA